MKNRLKFFAVAVALNVFYIDGYTQSVHKDRDAFRTDSIIFFFESEFIKVDNENVKWMPYEVQMPFPEFRYSIYGTQLKLSLFKISDIMNNVGGYSFTSMYNDSSDRDATYFNLNTLEYRIMKNEAIIGDWTPVLKAANHVDTSKYVDTMNVQVDRKKWEGKLFFINGSLLLHAENLSLGDSLHLSFRKEKEAPFLNFIFVKKDPLQSPPRSIGSFHIFKQEVSLGRFIQEAYKDYQGRDKSFYRNRPGESPPFGNDKVFEDSKLAFFFMPRADVNNDSAFEYRLIVNGIPQPWKINDNIIYVYDLKAGTQYQLEVRYRDKPQYVDTNRFYVPAAWYQSWWFKLMLGAILVLLSALTGLIIRNVNRRRFQQKQSNKIKALYGQLNPHFVFNALGSIQGLLNEGKIESANNYLSGFGKLLRRTLESNDRDEITLEQELANIQTYINLEQLRKPFNFSIQVSSALHPNQIEIPSSLFQPIIENAIKHGFIKKDKGVLLIDITEDKKDMVVQIKDNGIGFNPEAPLKGKGLQLTRDRIDLFNSTSKNRKIQYHVNSNEAGTSFEIKFINWL